MSKKKPEPFSEAFEKKRLYFYNPSLDKICEMDLHVDTNRETLAFARDSYALAEQDQVEFKRSVIATFSKFRPNDADDDGDDGDDNADDNNSLVGFPLKKAPKKAPQTETTYEERRRKEKADKHKEVLEKERAELQAQFAEDEGNNEEGHSYQIHSVDAPLALLSSSRIFTKDDCSVIFSELKSKGAFRPLARIQYDRFDAVFDHLAENHPLFEQVISYVRKSLRLCIQRGMPQVVPPMLLAGPPGLGKTHFAKAFAQELGAEFHLVAFDAEHKSSILLGQDKGWSNSTPGIVFEAVVKGNCANPVIVLDEIDKAKGLSTLHQYPLSSLHGLLEPITNKAVTDICVGLKFDASLISWICTCNYVDQVPATLLSRMKVFHIEQPADAVVALCMARVMLTTTHALIGGDIPSFEAPSMRLAKCIAHLSPREQRQELERAYAEAVSAGRRVLREEDFAHLDAAESNQETKQLLH